MQRALVVAEENILAQHLANQAIGLRRCDRWEEALPVATEACELHQRVVPLKPDMLEDAAQAAERLVTTLGHLDRREEAVPAAHEWIRYERALAEADPARVPELAEAVRVLGGIMLLAHQDDGLSYWRESLEILRRDGGHRATYAAMCSTVGRGFASVAEHDEALAVDRAGLTVRRELAAAEQGHFGDLLTELAEAAFSMRVYPRNSEPAAAQFTTEATALAREHASSISRAALAEAADLLDRAEFADEARELEELSDRKASS